MEAIPWSPLGLSQTSWSSPWGSYDPRRHYEGPGTVCCQALPSWYCWCWCCQVWGILLQGPRLWSPPPSSDALRLHILCGVYQGGHVCGKCLFHDPNLPDPAEWGWKRSEGLWIPLWIQCGILSHHAPGGGHCLCWGHYDVPLKWVTFGDPRVPTYGYTFGEMSLELGLIFHHRPYDWGPNSVFPVILVTRDT